MTCPPKSGRDKTGDLAEQKRKRTNENNNLLKNPKMGASWEGYAVEEILRKLNPPESYAWGGHNGPSLDLLCFKEGKEMGFEVKRQDAPRLNKGLLAALEILKLDDFKIIYPGSVRYALHEKIEVVPLEQWLVEA